MIGNEVQEQALKSLIEKTVDDSVDRAFKKHSQTSGFLPPARRLIAFLVILILVSTGVYWFASRERNNSNSQTAPVENHDLTLENNGIFGFTVADFEEAILGEATQQRLLIVEEQEVYVNTIITDTGLFNWGIFNKQQALTIHGTGQYTIDLTEISSDDISLNEETYEITVCIPHAELHQTIFDPSKTEIGDAQNGWLAFGSIKMDVEQQQEFEVTASEELKAKLSESECLKEADRFAKLSAYEVFQPIIREISPAYKIVIDFQ